MTYFVTASPDSPESQCIRSERHVTSCRGGQVELVVWLAQMVPAMPSILGDHSRIRTGRIWRWCRMAPPPRRVRANHCALRLCRSRLFGVRDEVRGTWAAMSGGYPGSRGHSPRQLLPGGLGDWAKLNCHRATMWNAELLRDPVAGPYPSWAPGRAPARCRGRPRCCLARIPSTTRCIGEPGRLPPRSPGARAIAGSVSPHARRDRDR